MGKLCHVQDFVVIEVETEGLLGQELHPWYVVFVGCHEELFCMDICTFHPVCVEEPEKNRETTSRHLFCEKTHLSISLSAGGDISLMVRVLVALSAKLCWNIVMKTSDLDVKIPFCTMKTTSSSFDSFVSSSTKPSNFNKQLSQDSEHLTTYSGTGICR